MTPQVGDRVVYHGDNKRWRGVAGRVRDVAPKMHFALVVPDSGMTPGFDVRWSLVDIHLEKSPLVRQAKPEPQCCPTCGQPIPA